MKLLSYLHVCTLWETHCHGLPLLSQESLTQHPTPPAWTKWQHRSQWCCIWDRKWWNTPVFQHIVWRGSKSVCSAETPWLSAHDPRICSQNEWMDDILPPFTVKCFQKAQVQFEGSSCFLLFLPRAQDFSSRSSRLLLFHPHVHHQLVHASFKNSIASSTLQLFDCVLRAYSVASCFGAINSMQHLIAGWPQN